MLKLGLPDEHGLRNTAIQIVQVCGVQQRINLCDERLPIRWAVQRLREVHCGAFQWCWWRARTAAPAGCEKQEREGPAG
jgi:hypothetical protein